MFDAFHMSTLSLTLGWRPNLPIGPQTKENDTTQTSSQSDGGEMLLFVTLDLV